MPSFFTANFGRHVGTPEFLHNLRKVDDEAGAGAVIFTQEIDEADTPNEHQGMRLVLGDDFSFAGWKTHEPIAFGAAWEVLEERVVKGASGLARLSPARTITEAIARYGKTEIVALGMHYPRNDPRLLSRWQQLREAHHDLIAHHHDKGRTVVWGSDVNRSQFTLLHRDEYTLARQGLDWIRCIEAPSAHNLIEPRGTGVVNLTIDGHNAPWAKVRFHPRSR